MKTIKKNLLYLYGYHFFSSFIFAYAIERIYWRSRGMTITQTVYTEFIYAAVILLLEIPSGVWADLWSRKRAVVFASFISLLEFILLIFAHNFWHFAFVVAMAGVGTALYSGALNALLYDTLVEIDKEDDFEKHLGRMRFVTYMSYGVAAIGAGLIAQYYPLVVTYYLSAISAALSVICTLLLREPSRHLVQDDEEGQAEGNPLRLALDFLQSSPLVRRIIAYGMLVGGSITYFDEFSQNYYDAVGIPLLAFGFLASISALVGAFSGAQAYTVRKWFHQRPWLLYHILLGSSALAYVSVSVFRHPVSIVFIYMGMASAAIMEVVSLSDLHRHASSAYRATAESAYSFIMQVSSIGFGILFSQLAKINLFAGYSGIGVTLATGLVILLVLKRPRFQRT